MDNLIPRHVWLKNRVIAIIKELETLGSINDWTVYKKRALELADELNYVCKEWDSYYI